MFTDNHILELAASKASVTMHEGYGGPFGAAIVNDEGIVSIESNSVLSDNDPTAHAEIKAIRAAGKILGTHDLSGCKLYATGYPCPMCMSAIIWAGINKVYVSGSPQQAAAIGFKDEFIYEYLQGKSTSPVHVRYCNSNIAQSLYDKYQKEGNKIY